ncbi:putative isomerase YbhE [Lenzites betulinus]|nr:putative isomerase YbhE [Lenzites betulinus]
MVYRILVASYTNEIYTLVFDPEAPSLELVSTVTVGHHPSWLTPHPKDRSIVFTGIEQSDGKIVALKFDAEGRGAVIGEVPSGGADPCALVALETELIIGNYSSGRFVAVPITTDVSQVFGSSRSTLQFDGTGPNKDRQESSHPHQVIPHPTRDELLVPDLGSDKTRRLVRETSGEWVEQGTVPYKAGSGPRHVAFHEDVLYTVLELTSELSAHRFPPLPSEPTLLDTISTMQTPPPLPLPPRCSRRRSSCRRLIRPSRHRTSTEANDGKIGRVAEVRSHLKHLRGMEFGGPDGRWLIAGGVHGGGVRVFERVDGGKGLKQAAEIELAAPTGFLWL